MVVKDARLLKEVDMLFFLLFFSLFRDGGGRGGGVGAGSPASLFIFRVFPRICFIAYLQLMCRFLTIKV